jgi:hypothetical protein
MHSSLAVLHPDEAGQIYCHSSLLGRPRRWRILAGHRSLLLRANSQATRNGPRRAHSGALRFLALYGAVSKRLAAAQPRTD